MKYRITVIAGTGFYSNGTPIPGHERNIALDRIGRYAADRFGGITIRQHWGAWFDNGKFVDEPGSTFEVLVDDYFVDNPDVNEARRLSAVAGHANAFATFIRSALQQKSVVLTIDKPAYAAFVE